MTLYTESPLWVGLINFCSLNARSVANKVDSFIDFVLSNNLDIVAITETWIKPTDNITINSVTPNGYSFLHAPIELTWLVEGLESCFDRLLM